MSTSLRVLLVVTIAVLVLPVFGPAPAAAQDKVAKCSNVRINVDVFAGGAWRNNEYVLALQQGGQGWTILEPSDFRGRNITATAGSKLRFNFNDGHGHMVDVAPSAGGGQALSVSSGSRPAIVLVEVAGNAQPHTAAVRFDVKGSPNANVDVSGCPGGSFYLDVP